ncbi:MAG: restriction endonuclease subunit S [Chloroflexota bacterium]|nr:restriction endonuclease subunit S [Chloroflexota bacterium]
MRFEEFAEINPMVDLEKGYRYPYVGMADVTPGKRYVSANRMRVYKRSGARFRDDDILFARITPSLEHGKIAQYKAEREEIGFGSTEFFVFRHREGVSDSSYLYYLALTDIVRKPAELSMTGASGRQRADLNVVKSIEIDPPPPPTQRKIAAILSAYDDLIRTTPAASPSWRRWRRPSTASGSSISASPATSRWRWWIRSLGRFRRGGKLNNWEM